MGEIESFDLNYDSLLLTCPLPKHKLAPTKSTDLPELPSISRERAPCRSDMEHHDCICMTCTSKCLQSIFIPPKTVQTKNIRMDFPCLNLPQPHPSVLFPDSFRNKIKLTTGEMTDEMIKKQCEDIRKVVMDCLMYNKTNEKEQHIVQKNKTDLNYTDSKKKKTSNSVQITKPFSQETLKTTGYITRSSINDSKNKENGVVQVPLKNSQTRVLNNAKGGNKQDKTKSESPKSTEHTAQSTTKDCENKTALVTTPLKEAQRSTLISIKRAKTKNKSLKNKKSTSNSGSKKRSLVCVYKKLQSRFPIYMTKTRAKIYNQMTATKKEPLHIRLYLFLCISIYIIFNETLF